MRLKCARRWFVLSGVVALAAALGLFSPLLRSAEDEAGKGKDAKHHGKAMGDPSPLDDAAVKGLIIEKRWVPLSDTSAVVIYRFKVGSLAEKALKLPEKKDSLTDKTVENIRILTSVVTKHDEFMPFPKDAFADRRGTGWFDGNYGFLCLNHQKFTRYNITHKQWEDLCWEAFGLCPHTCTWRANP